MLNILRNLLRPHEETSGFSFSRQLVLLHSDDWGRVGVRDQEGYDFLRSRGLRLGEHPYDLYTLETADDVNAVATLLKQHGDSTGRHPSLVMNVCTANFDFRRMQKEGYKRAHTIALADGLPSNWQRPGLFEAYRAGTAAGVFFPALHGATHCCPRAIASALNQDGERAGLLRLLWEAETPYIHWRMPWIGYEYWNPEKPKAGFLSLAEQRKLVNQARDNFLRMFGTPPVSACAPGYRSNPDTYQAWSDARIKVAVHGTGDGLRAPHMDSRGILHVYRTIDFEPSNRGLEVDKYLELAGTCFARGLPVVISIHSINFHSTLKDFRSFSIAALDRLLAALKVRYPEILYVHDQDLYNIVRDGLFKSPAAKVHVAARHHGSGSRAARAGAH